MSLEPAPFEVRHELPGWDLLWLRLRLLSEEEERLAALRREVAEAARANFGGESLASHPGVAAIRGLFRAAGCDPTRYRPSSEALIRRLLKGEELPAIHPLVDLNNCLSVELAVPCCVSAEGTFTPPVALRAGRPDESVQSMRGPFHLEGKPLLEDGQGPFSTPITDSERVRVTERTQRVWMVVYLPHGRIGPANARRSLEQLLGRAPLADVELAGLSTG